MSDNMERVGGERVGGERVSTVRPHEMQRGQFDAVPGDPVQYRVSELVQQAIGGFGPHGVGAVFFQHNYNQLKRLTNDELIAELRTANEKNNPAIWTATIASILAQRAESAGAPAAQAVASETDRLVRAIAAKLGVE